MFIHFSTKRLRRENFVLVNLLRKMILEMMTFENFCLENEKISSSMPCLYPSQQSDSAGKNSQKTARYSIYYGTGLQRWLLRIVTWEIGNFSSSMPCSYIYPTFANAVWNLWKVSVPPICLHNMAVVMIFEKYLIFNAVHTYIQHSWTLVFYFQKSECY